MDCRHTGKEGMDSLDGLGTLGMDLTCLLESWPKSRFSSGERQVRVSLVSGSVKLS